VAKLEAGQMSLTVTAVPLGAAFERVREATLGTALEKGLELTFAKPEPEIYAQGDAEFVRRMLINLVGNSLKFTLQGSVRVSAEADPADGQVILRVRDTGIGIPPEARERIFQKFGQVEGSRGQRRGTGLGLAFVKMAAESMGGSVTVVSEEGKGSTFTVRLPLAQPCPLPAPEAPLPWAGEGD
jgi:signal transduction histidine kinase